jgi:hypothetical protein
MEMNLFQASGPQIGGIESTVNQWLQTLTRDVEVKHVNTSTTAYAPTSGVNPLLTITITVWWGKR